MVRVRVDHEVGGEGVNYDDKIEGCLERFENAASAETANRHLRLIIIIAVTSTSTFIYIRSPDLHYIHQA